MSVAYDGDASLRDDQLPSLYRGADVTSVMGQRRYMSALRGVLAGSVVAAALTALATESDDWRWVAYVSALAFLATLGASVYTAVARPDRAWYDGRAAAESAKSLGWEYAVGGGPFCIATCADADELLMERLHEIVTKLKDFSIRSEAAYGEQITPAMREVRGRKMPARRDLYVRDRLEDQRNWYATKCKWNETRYHAWLIVSLAAQGAGVALAFLIATGSLEFDGPAVLAAFAAAVAAWVQAKDYSGLALAYGIAAQELGLARVRIENVPDGEEEAFASRVDDAELAISREHTLWLARRGSVTNAG